MVHVCGGLSIRWLYADAVGKCEVFSPGLHCICVPACRYGLCDLLPDHGCRIAFLIGNGEYYGYKEWFTCMDGIHRSLQLHHMEDARRLGTAKLQTQCTRHIFPAYRHVHTLMVHKVSVR